MDKLELIEKLSQENVGFTLNYPVGCMYLSNNDVLRIAEVGAIQYTAEIYNIPISQVLGWMDYQYHGQQCEGTTKKNRRCRNPVYEPRPPHRSHTIITYVQRDRYCWCHTDQEF